MIYQMQVYYGALINDKVIYSVAISFDDCTELLKEPFDIEPFKQELIRQIIEDGFSANDFTFDWITKEQYDNRIESKVIKNIKIDR